MKKILTTAFCTLPGLLLAHPGHPGPANHGNLTHALLGLLISLPLLFTSWMILRARNRRHAREAVRKGGCNIKRHPGQAPDYFQA